MCQIQSSLFENAAFVACLSTCPMGKQKLVLCIYINILYIFEWSFCRCEDKTLANIGQSFFIFIILFCYRVTLYELYLLSAHPMGWVWRVESYLLLLPSISGLGSIMLLVFSLYIIIFQFPQIQYIQYSYNTLHLIHIYTHISAAWTAHKCQSCSCVCMCVCASKMQNQKKIYSVFFLDVLLLLLSRNMIENNARKGIWKNVFASSNSTSERHKEKKLNYKSDFSFSVHLNIKEDGEE